MLGRDALVMCAEKLVVPLVAVVVPAVQPQPVSALRLFRGAAAHR
jgi:hypothetical protein